MLLGTIIEQRSNFVSRKRKQHPIAYLNGMSIIWDIERESIAHFIKKTTEIIEIERKQLEIEYQKWEREKRDYGNDFDWMTIYHGDSHFEDEGIKIAGYASVFYNSIFITIFSKLEIRLFQICEYCSGILELEIKAKDLAGRNYIVKAKKYIEKVIRVDLSKCNEEWQTILNYQQIRNSIVHSDGNRKITSDTLLKFIEDEEGIGYEASKCKTYIYSSAFVEKFNGRFNQIVDFFINEIVTQKTNST